MRCVKITTILLIVILLNSEPLFAPNLSKHHTEQKQLNKKRIIRLDELMCAEFSPKNLAELIGLLDIPSPKIVFNQAKLETGWFKSKLFTYHNNLFGMHSPNSRDTYSDRYTIADNGSKCASYGSWQSSVLDLLLYLEYYEDLGYDTEDYYKFLIDVGYCEGNQYTHILKSMA